MQDDLWIADEPTFWSVLRHLLARGRRRPRLVLGVAVALTAAILTLRVLKKPAFEASITFHLSEATVVDPVVTPRPPKDVGTYVASIALSRRQLERIMEQHHLLDGLRRNDPVTAVEELRKQITVEVTRNYFIEDRREVGEARSVYVTVTFRGADADQARGVIHQIRDSILEDQARRRGGDVEEIRKVIGAELNEARDVTAALQARIERLTAEAARATPGQRVAIRGRIAALETESAAAVSRALALEGRAAAIQASEAAEEEQIGLRFQLLDDSLAELTPRLSPAQLAVRALLLAALLSLVAAAASGAFDDRVYSGDDLVAWELPVLAALPRFEGDRAGAFGSRPRPGHARAQP